MVSGLLGYSGFKIIFQCHKGKPTIFHPSSSSSSLFVHSFIWKKHFIKCSTLAFCLAPLSARLISANRGLIECRSVIISSKSCLKRTKKRERVSRVQEGRYYLLHSQDCRKARLLVLSQWKGDVIQIYRQATANQPTSLFHVNQEFLKYCNMFAFTWMDRMAAKGVMNEWMSQSVSQSFVRLVAWFGKTSWCN